MKSILSRFGVVLCASCMALVVAGRAEASELRIVTYNVQSDTTGAAGANGGPGLTTVLQAIGSESLNGHAQPIDVLALQELYGTPSTTLQFLVNQLNGIYGAGTYAYDTANDPTDGNFLTGNGPSGLIYNTHTVQDLAATPIASSPPSGTTQPRDPMRYTLQPVGYDSSTKFYLYVSHAKSGTASSDATRRNIEMTDIRNDATLLGAHAHVIYAGDFNVNSSSELAYKTLVAAGIGHGNDIPNPTNNWVDSASTVSLLTESATSLHFRDDFQLVTDPVLNENGLQLVPNTYTVFGNNGTTAYGGATNAAGNTALGDLANRTAVLNALTTATDHLPVVADYAIVVPEPSSAILAGLAALALAASFHRRQRVQRRFG